MDSISRLANAAIVCIEQRALSGARVGESASSLGVSERHLRRVTESEFGASPIELAQTQRLLLAKRLLRETPMSLTDVAFASGFGSVRRFNALFRSRYRLSPGGVRGAAQKPEGLRVQLEFRPPFAWDKMLAYLRLRSIPGVELVDGTHYRRTAAFGASGGWISVSMAKSGLALDLEISPSLAMHTGAIIARVKQLFDLNASPDTVGSLLRKDRLLAPTVKRLPGLRVAGAFDGFEIAVRTVLGQQVSVKGASTIAGRCAAELGVPIATPFAGLNRLSPAAEILAGSHEDQVAALGMIGSRARCVIRLAKAVSDGRVTLSSAANVDEQVDHLQALPGIGPWTANYIAMRALHWPDAFPAGDLMLMRAAGLKQGPLLARAEAWRPWRAYAAQFLWQSLGAAP
jgi:AraC family transcriptional regulator of adaptative response / DNA-3-methyladenine glycosylase II